MMMDFIGQFVTKEQMKGLVERGLTIGATWLVTWLVSKGYVSASDSAQLIVLIVGAISGFYGWWINRDKALVQAAAAVPNTVVVTEHTLAASTPEPNIVSAATTEVVPKT